MFPAQYPWYGNCISIGGVARYQQKTMHEEHMNAIRKCLTISGLAALGAAGALLLASVMRRKDRAGRCEKVGKGVDEKLKESKAALDKAAARVQSVFDHIKNRKP
jgi:hypothetical protein